MRADDSDHGSRGLAPYRLATREHGDVMTFLMPQAELSLVRTLVARDCVGQRLGSSSIVWMKQPLPCTDMRFDLVVAVPEHPLPLIGVHHGPCFEVPVPDAFLRASECELQPLLALAQRALGTSAFRHVADDQRYRRRRFTDDR